MFSVMIADDYEIFRQEIRSMDVWGEASGFVIADEAFDGRDALARLRQQTVDLLLTDIRMPFINGLELLKIVTEEKLCTCVVLMSQFGDFEYARQGLSNGAFEYLLKPLDPGELLACLKRAAQYINARTQEIAKISYLDQILNQSSEEYFPHEDMDNLLNLIEEGSPNALNAAAGLVNAVYAEVGSDTFKTAHILNKLTNKLIASVQNEYKWLGKFMNLQTLKASDISADTDISGIKDVFTGKIDKLLGTIRQYELGIDNSSMVRMACRTVLENIDTEISVNEIANMLFITRTYLSQTFKEKTGIKLVDYLTSVRIERAKVLISSGRQIDDVLDKLGYKDFEYFKKLFKKVSGMTINEYRNVISY
jgi:two-component system response regulator YesN